MINSQFDATPHNKDREDVNENQKVKIFTPTTGSIFAEKFIIQEKIGSGSFGSIFKIRDLEQNICYASKFEPKERNDDTSLLGREIKILIDLKFQVGFPQIEYYGREDNVNFCIMNLLGENLETLLQKCGGKFNKYTVQYIATQAITRIQDFHQKGFMHRDIKTENFTLGANDEYNNIHLIDFGLAKKYLNFDGSHIKYISNKGMIGTARYASINAHLGHEQSRKDDLESIGYMLIYFSKGVLPWMNLKMHSKKDKYGQIRELKQSISVKQLCEGLPISFFKYVDYVKKLKFEDAPDYTYLKNLFTSDEPEQDLDWEKIPEYQRRKKKLQQQKLKQSFSNLILEGNENSPKSLTSFQNLLQLPKGQKGRENSIQNSIGTSNVIQYEGSLVADEKDNSNDVQINLQRQTIIPKGIRKISINMVQRKQSLDYLEQKNKSKEDSSNDEIEDETHAINESMKYLETKMTARKPTLTIINDI